MPFSMSCFVSAYRSSDTKSPDEAANLKEQAKAITKKLVPLRKQKQIAQRIEEDIPKIRDWIGQERAIESGVRKSRDTMQCKR